MTKQKELKREIPRPLLGEVHFIVPARNKGFPSDARALDAISELNKQKPLDAVGTDQCQAYSLAYRYCVEKGIDFISIYQDIRQNPNCIEELLTIYQKRLLPNIAYLTNFNDCKTLSDIAYGLAAKGVKTEIRKVF